jgi:hypothetical protein
MCCFLNRRCTDAFAKKTSKKNVKPVCFFCHPCDNIGTKAFAEPGALGQKMGHRLPSPPDSFMNVKFSRQPVVNPLMNMNVRRSHDREVCPPSLLPLILIFLLFLAPVRLLAADPTILTVPANSSDVAIQSALDQLPDGGEVVLAPGTYQIRQPIILRHDRQTLRGSGNRTLLRLADGANCPVVVLGSPVKSRPQATTGLRLADLAIDGNRKNQRGELWRRARDGSLINNNGIAIWDVTDSTVERVVCCRCRSGGLVMAQTRRIVIRDFTAYDNEYDGLACYFTEDSKFSDLCLRDNLAAGISLDLDFNHNEIACATLTGNDLGVFMRDSRNNVFQSVTIDRSHRHGVFMAQTDQPTREGWKLVPGTECTGNVFNGPLITNCGGYGFLINDASCTNNIISDPLFANNADGGLVQSDDAKRASARFLAMP